MKLRRGFKKESEEIAVELRRELGLAPEAALCRWELARHLEIAVYTLATVQQCEPEAAAYRSFRAVCETSITDVATF